MTSNGIKNIIFDLGGVLIDWNPRYLYKKLFKDYSKMEWFLDNVCTFDWNEKQDGGRDIIDANQELLDKFPDWSKEILAFYGRWEEMLGGPIPEMVKLLETLHLQDNFNLYALTNWSHETFPIAQERYDFLQCFKDIVVSGVEKIKKPDPAIYKLLLDRNKLHAEECLFIDDNLRNIEMAKKLNIHAIHYKGIDSIMLSI